MFLSHLSSKVNHNSWLRSAPLTFQGSAPGHGQCLRRKTVLSPHNVCRAERLGIFLEETMNALVNISSFMQRRDIHFMNNNLIFAGAFGIGVVAGLRSLTAPAAVSWAVYLGWLSLAGSPLAFMGSIAAVVTFSLLAIGELIADLLPGIPKRTAPGPLIARVLTGGLCGACLGEILNQPALLTGAILGAIGAVIGALAGYEIRRRLVSNLNIKDIFVALPEDLIAIGLALFLVSRQLQLLAK